MNGQNITPRKHWETLQNNSFRVRRSRPSPWAVHSYWEPSKERWEVCFSAIGGFARTSSAVQAHARDRKILMRESLETVENVVSAAAQCLRTKAPYGSVKPSSWSLHSYWKPYENPCEK